MLKKTKIGLALISSILSTQMVQASKFLIVASSTAPFEFLDESGNVVGMDVDITKAIFKKMGHTAEIKILPWARAWSMIESGEADASLTTSRKDKRLPFVIYPTEDLWTSEFTIFSNVTGKSKGDKSYADLVASKAKVGVIKGYSYNDAFWKSFPNRSDKKLHKQLKEAKDLTSNFKKLDSSRIDAIVEDKITGKYTFNKLLGLKNIQSNEAVLFSKGYPMAFSKKSSHPDIQSVVNQYDIVLKEMKENGEYDALKNKWLGN